MIYNSVMMPKNVFHTAIKESDVFQINITLKIKIL